MGLTQDWSICAVTGYIHRGSLVASSGSSSRPRLIYLIYLTEHAVNQSDLNEVPLFCTTEFGLHLPTVFSCRAILACFRLGCEKSAPHRAISTEQHQHRNNQKGGSVHYSPLVLPFFPADQPPEFCLSCFVMQNKGRLGV